MAAGWKWAPNPAVSHKTRDAAARGIGLAAEHIIGEAIIRAPREEGDLRRSGDYDLDPAKLEASVYFDTPYAVKQHEDLSLRHIGEGEAKYLENALNAETATARDIIAKSMRGEL
ncbi:hypothetical protein [Arthrobacter sp. GMC3]|uniref:hypothetical protein n=1 Tax=Arthrobacter sp. GMC3 TaxID=2058894 RepID=UPI000CE3C792|nr:hypothetical protein [Arthrobacter sp. GMC3]